jgi:hypothetical protein
MNGTVAFSVITHHHDGEATWFPCLFIGGHSNVFEITEGLEKTTH